MSIPHLEHPSVGSPRRACILGYSRVQISDGDESGIGNPAALPLGVRPQAALRSKDGWPRPNLDPLAREGWTLGLLRRWSAAVSGPADPEPRWQRRAGSPRSAGEIRRAVFSGDRRAVAPDRAGRVVRPRRLDQSRPLGGSLHPAQFEPFGGGADRGGRPAEPEPPAGR